MGKVYIKNLEYLGPGISRKRNPAHGHRIPVEYAECVLMADPRDIIPESEIPKLVPLLYE